MTNQKILFLVLTLLATKGNTQGLDLETCMKMADTANLSIRNSRLDVDINERERKAYLSARLPKLAFTGDYKYNAIIPGQVVPGAFVGGPPGTYTTVQFGVPYSLSNNLQLTQILYNPQVEYGFAALKINREIVEIQQRMTTTDIKYQVASTFFNLQAINRQLTFVDGNILNMEKLIRNMEAMALQEMVIQTEVDKLSINRLSLVNTQASLKSTKEQLETLLKILIGMEPNAPITLVSDDLVEKTILVDNSAVAFPELELLAAQQRMNAEERKGNNMAYLPSLSAYATYNYNLQMKPENDYREGINGAFIGLRLDWTLFDGLEKYQKQKSNALNAEKLQNQKELTEQQLEMRANNAKRQIDVQSGSLSISQEQLKLAERVYKQTESKFELGTVGSNDLITAENAMQQAQTNVVASYIQLRQAELEYLKAIGNIK